MLKLLEDARLDQYKPAVVKFMQGPGFGECLKKAGGMTPALGKILGESVGMKPGHWQRLQQKLEEARVEAMAVPLD